MELSEEVKSYLIENNLLFEDDIVDFFTHTIFP